MSEFKTLDLTVFPSTETTISVQHDEAYGGAHLYSIQNCLGFADGQTQYQPRPTWAEFSTTIPSAEREPDASCQTIQFVHKADDGTITPGLQSEQVVLMLLDRTEKLNARFPSPHNDTMIEHLKGFLAASEARVKERVERGVMGNLSK